MAEAYGVFSQPVEDSDGPRALHRVESTKSEALKWMARYALFRAFGVVELETFQKLAATLHTVVAEGDDKKSVVVDGLELFVEPTQDWLAGTDDE